MKLTELFGERYSAVGPTGLFRIRRALRRPLLREWGWLEPPAPEGWNERRKVPSTPVEPEAVAPDIAMLEAISRDETVDVSEPHLDFQPSQEGGRIELD